MISKCDASTWEKLLDHAEARSGIPQPLCVDRKEICCFTTWSNIQ